jgi:hypothetical protein
MVRTGVHGCHVLLVRELCRPITGQHRWCRLGLDDLYLTLSKAATAGGMGDAAVQESTGAALAEPLSADGRPTDIVGLRWAERHARSRAAISRRFTVWGGSAELRALTQR